MNPLLTTTLHPIVLANLFQSLPQKPGTSFIALVMFFLFVFFTSSGQDFTEMPTEYNKEDGERIEAIARRVEALAIVTHSYEHGGLIQKYSSDPAITPKEVPSAFHDGFLDKLRAGDCARILVEDGGIASDARDYPLPGIVCPIVHNGRLIGAISGVYRSLPDPAPDGSDNPISRELFFLGTTIYQ